MKNDAQALIGTVAVARLLGVHPKHVYRLLHRGLPAHRLGGEWRYDTEEVLAWVQQRSSSDVEVRHTADTLPAADAQAPPLLAANGDVCVELLLRAVAEANGQTIGFVPADRSSGRKLVLSRYVVAAGVHGVETGEQDGLSRVHVTRRQLGLAFPKAKRFRSISSVAGARLATRASSAGIRGHFDAALREQRADPDQVQRRSQLHASHRDVVLAILSGHADAGITTVAWAARAGLGCLPFAEERYELCLHATELARASGRSLVQTLQGRAFRRLLTSAAGYDPKDAGVLRL